MTEFTGYQGKIAGEHPGGVLNYRHARGGGATHTTQSELITRLAAPTRSTHHVDRYSQGGQ